MNFPAKPFVVWTLAACVAIALAGPSTAQTPQKVDAQAYQQAVSKGIEYLRGQGQAEDGSYSGFAGPGITALVTTAIMEHGRSPEDPLVAKSLKYLEQFVRDDGGIHAEETLYRNYETSLAILCFTKANTDGRYDKVLKRADGFLKGIQWGDPESADVSDPAYGGGGYGKHKRPDLSNTSFLVEALKATGNDADSEAIRRALIFVSRCQNLETEHNTTPFASKNPDGGFYYTPAAGGTSQAGETPQGGLRSYGSMTYAGLKSMIYAGVEPDDPRVKAAIEWIGKNYDLETNPGMGSAGLYYYYHTFAKALAAIDQPTFVDQDGTRHHWRAELAEVLIEQQRPDGSWINGNERWLEGDPNLVTAYALMSLAYCREP